MLPTENPSANALNGVIDIVLKGEADVALDVGMWLLDANRGFSYCHHLHCSSIKDSENH